MPSRRFEDLPCPFRTDPAPSAPSQGQARCVRVALEGRIDYSSLSAVKPLLRRIEGASGLCVRIDLARVEFMDSCGIGLLLAVQDAVRRGGGTVGFENHAPRVRRILERSGVCALIAPAGDPCWAEPASRPLTDAA